MKVKVKDKTFEGSFVQQDLKQQQQKKPTKKPAQNNSSKQFFLSRQFFFCSYQYIFLVIYNKENVSFRMSNVF